ncbi:MAG: hypothetical protein WBZ33_05360 [Thermoactinomyces sp.]
MSTKIPKTASRKKTTSIKKGAKSRLPAKSTNAANKPKSSVPSSSLLSQLSSINIAKLLNGFMTFRSTIKELNASLQKMESMMDSAYQIFAITSQMMGPGKRGARRFPLLPPFWGDSGASPNRRANQILPPFKGNPDAPPNWQTNQSSPFSPDSDENIPTIQLPFDERRDPETPGMPFAPLLQNMNLGQLINILRSPVFQKMISNLFRFKK